ACATAPRRRRSPARIWARNREPNRESARGARAWAARSSRSTVRPGRNPMPKVSKQTASSTEQAPGYEGRFEDLGGYTVAFETYSEDADLAPLFAGLPDDRCQCPHW